MLPSSLLLALTTLCRVALAQTTSPKRGLIYIPSTAHPEDDKLWLDAPTSLTWYYNYQSLPSDVVKGTPADLEFVPMLWGDHDNTFVKDVRSQLPGIKYVLGFNEPDMDLSVGGTNITPERAAELWKNDIEPLAADGVKLGAPGVSSAPDGMQWLKDFLAACDSCTIDFIPIHWYGNFEGLASHLGHYRVTFPDHDLWVTELGYAHVDIETTKSFFNTTISYLDNLDYVTHYSWFGAFRSDVSNVGPSGAMLTANGKLTDIGAWYLGEEGTGESAASGRSVGWAILAVTGFASLAMVI